jgi:hypothetical protein
MDRRSFLKGLLASVAPLPFVPDLDLVWIAPNWHDVKEGDWVMLGSIECQANGHPPEYEYYDYRSSSFESSLNALS